MIVLFHCNAKLYSNKATEEKSTHFNCITFQGKQEWHCAFNERVKYGVVIVKTNSQCTGKQQKISLKVMEE